MKEKTHQCLPVQTISGDWHENKILEMMLIIRIAYEILNLQFILVYILDQRGNYYYNRILIQILAVQLLLRTTILSTYSVYQCIERIFTFKAGLINPTYVSSLIQQTWTVYFMILWMILRCNSLPYPRITSFQKKNIEQVLYFLTL